MTLPSRDFVPTNWIRSIPFHPEKESLEIWTHENHSGRRALEVRVSFGKKLDAFSLKQKVVSDFEKSVSEIRRKNETLFASRNLEEVRGCPICGEAIAKAVPAASFYGGTYHHCLRCDHYFVAKRPSQKALEAFYAKDKTYQSTYADPDLLKIRLESVAFPKIQWVLREFKTQFQKPPATLLDVGAGSGHMVKASLDLGLKAEGIELSETGIKFAKSNFGIELKNLDFVEKGAVLPSYNIITFWGLIEHVPDPLKMLEMARNKLKKENGMVVVEVPRWHSLTTEVQKLFNNRIVRHLDPSSHIHLFSDTSLANAFVITGLRPVAAWYFGLDAYEAAVQLVREHGGELEAAAKYVPYFQTLLDQNRLSDFLVLAGVPE